MSELQKFEINSLKDTIANKIKGEFVNLIPDEAWQNLVETEVRKFTVDVPGDGYNKKEKAPLKQLIEDELKTIFREQITEELKELKWIGGREAACQLVKDIITHNSSEIVSNVLSTTIQQVVQQAISNTRPRY